MVRGSKSLNEWRELQLLFEEKLVSLQNFWRHNIHAIQDQFGFVYLQVIL